MHKSPYLILDGPQTTLSRVHRRTPRAAHSVQAVARAQEHAGTRRLGLEGAAVAAGAAKSTPRAEMESSQPGTASQKPQVLHWCCSGR